MGDSTNIVAQHPAVESAKVSVMAKPTGSQGTSFHLTRASRLESWRMRRQMERRRQEVAQAIRQKPFPLYGLPASWEGRREVSGSSYGKKSGLGRVRLGHWSGEGPRAIGVQVDIWRGSDALEDAKEDMEYTLELRNDDDEALGELEWRQMRVPVDGAATDFEVIAGRDRRWGAVGVVADVVVGVEVQNFAITDVVLEKITDVEPYISGSEERSRELHRKKR